jgi:Icc protein
MLICQLTDLHVRPMGKAANRVSETNMFTERAFRAVARFNPRPDVVLITGDLTECGLAEEYANLTALLRKWLSMPVFIIPGNHDRRGNLRNALEHLPGVTTDPEYVQYVVDDHPVRIVMLDTLVPGAGHGELRPEQLEFLDRTLATAPDKPTLIGMHHPPFACGIAHMDRINLRNSPEFTAIIARHRQVERIICGHHHRPIVARVAHAIASISPSVAHQVEMSLAPGDGGAFLFEPPAFQLHRWTPADGIVSHTVYVDDYPGPYPFVNDAEYPGRT